MPHNAPLKPISGHHIEMLYPRLDQVFAQGKGVNGKIRGLDIAMLMNVPPGRMPSFHKAQGGGGATADAGAGTDTTGDDERSSERIIKPSQAILTRLLLRHPEYAPLVPIPAPQEVWQQIRPLIPEWLFGKNRKQVTHIVFAPLFGRSYPTSYKLLGSSEYDDQPASEPPTNVTRLFMLVLEKLGDVFRRSLMHYLDNHAPQSFVDDARRAMRSNWLVLHQQEQLVRDFIPEHYQQTFLGQVLERKRGWFELYLQVLQDEAASREIDAYQAIARGYWRNKEPVSQALRQKLSPRQQPITGSSQFVFDKIRQQVLESGDSNFGEMTSAEFFWLMGVPVKTFYTMHQKGEHRIDAPTAILARYLYRYTSDVSLMLEQAGRGSEIYAAIRRLDESFRAAQLAPLFGGGYVSSFHFVKDGRCPNDLRRLTGIFMREIERNPDIYWQIRQCAEEEAYARGIDSRTFWKRARWSLPSATEVVHEP